MGPPPSISVFSPGWLLSGLPVTFDPTTVINGSLSGGNLVFTSSNTTADGGVKVATANGQSSGKFYFEITITALDGAFHNGYGICTSASTYAGANAGTVGIAVNTSVSDTGQIFSNGSQVATMGVQGNTGDVWAIAVNLDAGTGWFRVKKFNLGTFGFWNASGTASPAANSGGVTIPAGVMVPFVRTGSFGATGATYTANFGASPFVGNVP